MKKNTGFTLAEVLITLTIIGVVAALTIPTLVQNTNKQENVTALKKAYSMLSQAAQMIIAEEGSPKADENGESWLKDSESMFNMFKKHTNNAKECSSGDGCIDQQLYYLDGHSRAGWNGYMKKLVLADGTQVMFVYSDKTCSKSLDGAYNYCGHILVDVNGEKKPNRLGRDVFWFLLKENGVFPRGCDEDGFCERGGWGCACKVLREGKMDY